MRRRTARTARVVRFEGAPERLVVVVRALAATLPDGPDLLARLEQLLEAERALSLARIVLDPNPA